MKEIHLTKDMFANLDDEAWAVMKDYNWQAITSFGWKSGQAKHYFARRTACINGLTFNIYMHRQLMGVPKPLNVRHKNSNYLDNRHENMYIDDEWGNVYRFKKFSTQSMYKGVIWDRANGLWRAEIKNMVIGYYIVELDAARAYNLKIIEVYGRVKSRMNKIKILRDFNQNKRNRVHADAKT